MTENEAIEYMENEVRCIKQASHCDRDCLKCGLVKEEQPLLESFAVAINALEEIQAYHAIGTVEECREAVEKQIPQKPIEQKTDEKTHYKCKCGFILRTEYTDGYSVGLIPNYCGRCGKKLS